MIGYIIAITHGGYCCGMTHLYHFPTYPNTPLPARTQLEGAALTEHYRIFPHHVRHVSDTRPAETAEERFRAIVGLIPSPISTPGQTYACRPSGIIEVVLTAIGGHGTAENWRPLLTELGFKEVNQHRNSNSGRMLHVFHLNTGV